MEEQLALDVVRAPEEVARRALALFSIVGIALGAPKSDVVDWLADSGLEADLAPSERRFIESQAPSQQQIVNASWLSERLVVLCWALEKIAELPHPDEQCDTAFFQEILPPFADMTAAGFLAEAKLRSDRELIEKAGEIMDQHSRARNAKLTGSPPKIPVDIEIIQERHHAINWIIGYERAPWDEVATDT